MKKWMNFIFGLAFLALLLAPLLTINLKQDQISEIDNEYLPEMDWTLNGGLPKKIETYVDARIGFREEALDLYQKLNDQCFGLMEHPIYMYGKDGYVFFKQDAYLRDYQHLNLDEEWAQEFVASLGAFSNAAHERGMDFIYLFLPDKKTIYPEYFPDSIRVKGEVSRTDQVLAALEHTDIDWIWAKEAMLKGKETMQVCNVKYDAGHWNDNGAFLVYQRLYEEIRKYFPEVPALSLEDYTIEMHRMTSLPTSKFAIWEEVPIYQLKEETTAVADYIWAEEHLFFPAENSYYNRYVNPAKQDQPKLLVFHDSYMLGDERFFYENFSEVTFIHRSNLVNEAVYERYLDLVQPDLVIYENPERVLPITFDGSYDFSDS